MRGREGLTVKRRRRGWGMTGREEEWTFGREFSKGGQE